MSFVARLALGASLGCSSVGPNEPTTTAHPAGPSTDLLSPSIAAHRCPLPWLSWTSQGRCISVGANDPSRIIRFRLGAPQLQASEVSFWAVRGQLRSAALRFVTGSPYVELAIPAGALRSLPSGQPIAWGDSVLITIRALSTEQMLWQLLPEGLTFNPAAPAELVARYDQANHDFDGDGDIDLFDRLIELRLAIWRQPLGQLFAELSSLVDPGSDRISADVPGFSRFGIAY
jgi:hypothetical protein